MSRLDQMLGSARRGVAGLRDLMEDLLGDGSIQSGRLRVYPRSVEPRAIAEDAIVAVGPPVEIRQQRIVCDRAEDVISVLVDRRHGRRVLAHLLGNASTYGPSGELIRVDGEVGVGTSVWFTLPQAKELGPSRTAP